MTPFFLFIYLLKMLPKASIFVFIVLTACTWMSDTKHNEDIAGVKHFYFEFIDHVQSEYSVSMIEQVSTILPQYDYLISKESAVKGWPFYGNVKRGSILLKTEMMPPHSNVNRLSPIKELTNFNKKKHIMRVLFTIESINDSTLRITKESFQWSAEGWHQFSKKISTDFDIKLDNQQEVVSNISKTLIRYTFK